MCAKRIKTKQLRGGNCAGSVARHKEFFKTDPKQTLGSGDQSFSLFLPSARRRQLAGEEGEKRYPPIYHSRLLITLCRREVIDGTKRQRGYGGEEPVIGFGQAAIFYELIFFWLLNGTFTDAPASFLAP